MKDIDGNGYYDINDFLNMKNEEILEMNKGKKFDVLLSNTPFNLGVKFFQKYFEIADKIITIQPTKWLLTNKQNKNLTNKIDNQYCEIETVNGNEYFDAGLFADVSINYVDSQKPHKLFFNKKEYNKCENITKFSTDALLEEFSKKINVDDSIWDNIKGTTHWDKGYESNPNNEWWCIKIQKIRGNVNRNKNEKQSPDFYTLISNNEEFIKLNKGQYKKLKETPNKRGNLDFLYFAFNTEQELNNFIRYIKTDFARACLMLVKNGANLHRGEMRYIPWFDFSDELFTKSPKEIDDWLFNKYHISKKIRKHIEEILPDYYDIRK